MFEELQGIKKKKFVEHVDYYTDNNVKENPNLFLLNRDRKNRYGRKQW